MKLLLFFSLFFNNPSRNDLYEMRNLFPLVGKKEAYSERMLHLSNTSLTTTQNLRTAYEGVARMAYAKHKLNPYSKYKSFIEGRNLLELAIKTDSQNLEIRFLRYIIQNHAPSFLGYNKSIEDDKSFILKQLPSIKKEDTDLYSRIYNYFITVDKLSPQEKLALAA